jgi:predicted nuclease with TOPRIM domain
MLWTVLSLLCVLAVKFVTVLRLKELKKKMEEGKPHIERLRAKLAEVEEEYKKCTRKQQSMQARMIHLKDVVDNLQNHLEKSDATAAAEERLQVLQNVKDRS